jgi:hypothetical protein
LMSNKDPVSLASINYSSFDYSNSSSRIPT